MEQKIRRDRNMGDNLKRLRLDHNISQENYVQSYNGEGVTSAVLRMRSTKLGS